MTQAFSTMKRMDLPAGGRHAAAVVIPRLLSGKIPAGKIPAGDIPAGDIPVAKTISGATISGAIISGNGAG